MNVDLRDYIAAVEFIAEHNSLLCPGGDIWRAQECLDGLLAHLDEDPEADAVSSGGFVVRRTEDEVQILVHPGVAHGWIGANITPYRATE